MPRIVRVMYQDPSPGGATGARDYRPAKNAKKSHETLAARLERGGDGTAAHGARRGRGWYIDHVHLRSSISSELFKSVGGQ